MAHIRAAFDLGSSYHKLVVALVSPSCPPTIIFSTSIRVPLADALTPANTLPPSALRASRRAFARLHALAIAHGAVAFAALATAVFRTASNGPPHLAALPVPAIILEPRAEGALAFASALALAPRDPVPVDPVVWDSGGASTQWAMHDADGFHVRAVPLGSSSVRARYRQASCVRELRNWIAAVAGAPGDRLATRLAQQGVVLGIGSEASMFALAAQRKGHMFSESDVWDAVDKVERGGEEEVIVLPKLVLLAELMGQYNILRVRFVHGNGSCVGLLASKEERFWGKPVVERSEVTPMVRRDDRIFVERGHKAGVAPSCQASANAAA